MGARQSKRSVDITTTPKKGEDGVVEGEGKVEKIAEIDAKVTTNGAIHTEIEYADKDESTKEEPETADIKENGVSESEDAKTPEGDTVAAGDQLNESATVSEKSPENGDKDDGTPENKKNKEKSKKKKWSFRSISFSKKDKSKPSKESEKNGDVKEVVEEVSKRFEFVMPQIEIHVVTWTRAITIVRRPVLFSLWFMVFF
ncbi:pollen-specific leucine-rich repeat extensin-like protein 1 [Asbolus verrucosus]|uniref:Pollen-specific leucine-rich repeat extensin-like protein 1 n=1 Tax=Asbolus verrucosus TaxID=1661398 RepID=A0A482VGF4_ASBVE|nr:pollen-specific leucine-rich repeat extensin-like protein 1 [Asbolus verrucosus]